MLRHSCQRIWKSSQEWPADKVKSETKLLSQEGSKLQELIVYTDGSVTTDQARWGFTAKEGATTNP